MTSDIGWTAEDSEARRLRVKQGFRDREEIEKRIQKENEQNSYAVELRKALKPFADLAIWIAENKPDYNSPAAEVQIEGWAYTISVGDLKNALELLKPNNA